MIMQVLSKMVVPKRKLKSFDLMRSSSFRSAASSSGAPSPGPAPLSILDLDSPPVEQFSLALVPLAQPSMQDVATCVEDVEGSLRSLRDMSNAFEVHVFRKAAKL